MNEQSQSRQDIVGRRMKQLFALFAIIGGFFIVAEHRAHLIPYLPWLLLAACPLMHLFMHHGHGGHQHHGSGDEPERERNASEAGSVTDSGPGNRDARGTSHHRHGERS